MKKNNSLKVQIITALGAFAGAVLCCYYRKHRQVNDVIKAISDTLGDEEVTDFKSFSEHLSEYHGITAKNIYGNVVEYSSDSIKSITSDEIQSIWRLLFLSIVNCGYKVCHRDTSVRPVLLWGGLFLSKNLEVDNE